MKAKIYFEKLEASINHRDDIEVKKYSLKYKNGIFPFWKIQSKKINNKDRIFLIRAGIHGEEVAGPLTILKHLNEILDKGKKFNMKFIIYPLDNPSGFEKGSRYNIDQDKGEFGNNDYVRYQLKNEELCDELRNIEDYKNWNWSSNLTKKLPLETKLSQKLLKKDPLNQVVAFLDLHQDYITQNVPALAYHYSFENLEKYNSIIRKISKIIPLYKNQIIGSGFNVTLKPDGKIIQNIDPDAPKSDKSGFVIRHDGSLGDLFYRMKVKYNVTVETTGQTPLDKATKINILWIYGILNLLK